MNTEERKRADIILMYLGYTLLALFFLVAFI